ncbi:MAG: hypothetical protein KGY67_01395 [Candidatus Thermoplasmatota archaeon]|nr:hypothetical protein [Candidatus Thermoplasmatota archaeon]
MKKQFIVLFLIAIFLSSSSYVFSMPTNQNFQTETITLSLSASSISTAETEDFISISIPEATGKIKIPTHPSLPIITKTITLPFGSTIQSLNYEISHQEEITIDTQINPVAYPTPLNPSITLMEKEINQEIYESSSPYPSQTINSRIAAGLHDEKLVNTLTLTWHPIQYIPTEDTLEFSKEITISITYKPGSTPVQETNENKLVIIGPESFADETQPLIDHKNDYNVQTMYTSVEQIYRDYTGRDHAEQIKKYIYDVVKTQGVSYALLLGSVELTPMRETAIRVYHDDNILTDLYYADVFESDGSFSSWDTNNNDKFSEYNWEDGLLEHVDLYPDLHVGRIPCEDEKEVKTIVNKIITYENTAASSSWYKKIILMAGDTFPGHGVIEGELVTQHIAEIMESHGFEPVKLWTSKGNFNPLTINKELTAGAGFISYSGHGYEQGFGTSPPDVEQRIEYFTPYLFGVFNGYKLPVIFFDACSTTKLDFTIEDLQEWYPLPLIKVLSFIYGIEYELDSLYPPISWQIVKKSNGGCIASIGSTRVAFTGVDEDGAHWGAGFLNTHFYEAYEPGAKLGELFTQCQTDYLNEVGTECITLQEFILIGDPSLQLGGFA